MLADDFWGTRFFVWWVRDPRHNECAVRKTRYLVLVGVAAAALTAIAAAFAIEDKRDRALMYEMGTAQSELLSMGAQISSIKDGNLATPNDFIAAYAQVEPLEKEYDQKLEKFSQLYNAARERDSHLSLLDLQRFRGTHHPKTWEKMSEIEDLGSTPTGLRQVQVFMLSYELNWSQQLTRL